MLIVKKAGYTDRAVIPALTLNVKKPNKTTISSLATIAGKKEVPLTQAITRC